MTASAPFATLPVPRCQPWPAHGRTSLSRFVANGMGGGGNAVSPRAMDVVILLHPPPLFCV